MESHLGGDTVRKQAATCKPRETASRETILIFTLSLDFHLDCQLHQKYGRIFRYDSITLRRNCSELLGAEHCLDEQWSTYYLCSKRLHIPPVQKQLSAVQMSQQVKVLAPSLMTWVPSWNHPPLPWWKTRTDSHILPSKLHTCAMTCVYPHSYVNTRKKSQLSFELLMIVLG